MQFRLTSDSFNTTVANWQGVDDKPKKNSKNFVESGGVEKAIDDAKIHLSFQIITVML